MSKIEETAKKVIDELLDHDENFQNTDSYPTRCDDSIQVLDGCSKILKGSYRSNEIVQKIKDSGITVSVVKKILSVLLLFLLFFCFGCGSETPKSETPKDVVKSFISACESQDYKKASQMTYDKYTGAHFKESNDDLKKVSGNEHTAWVFVKVIRSSPIPRITIKVAKKFRVSPREALIDPNNPNQCKVFVFVERKFKSGPKDVSASIVNVRQEKSWWLEKINGKWMITFIEDADMIIEHL